MGNISSEVIEFYDSINSVIELIRSITYEESTDQIKFLILVNFRDYIGHENIDTYSYQQEMFRLISIKRKEHIDNELDSLFTNDEQLFILNKSRASYIVQRAEKNIHQIIRYPEIDEFELIIKYLDARIHQLETLKLEENIPPIELLNSVPSKLLLLKELKIFDQLKSLMEHNTDTDLATIIAFIIGYEKPKTILRYLPYMNIDNEFETKRSPYTEPAIKEMKRALLESNIKLSNDYSKFVKSE